MQIPKDKVVELLRQRGDHDRADQAEQELPDQVDPDQHADLLSKHGIDRNEALGKLGL